MTCDCNCHYGSNEDKCRNCNCRSNNFFCIICQKEFLTEIHLDNHLVGHTRKEMRDRLKIIKKKDLV
ncbi:hypothetical protein QIT55_gp33 [Nitrosopumilus spindle-shaped virus]|uniref:C2H2-type domain-containing protein n=1 Tax=Nitrosopumilus spindle-shaped virus 1 TaxID=2848002 RepID=A0A514K301_9VIRU|nr:hypothetical protein QIT55_gp33 [Nitrosopumilus spindle-shaped virus]QDI74019.1 hypothetical protein [Nitrosopumilus spindle-shaped virus]